MMDRFDAIDQMIYELMHKVFPQVARPGQQMFNHSGKLFLYRGVYGEGEFWVQVQTDNTNFSPKLTKQHLNIADPDVVNKLEHLKTLAES